MRGLVLTRSGLSCTADTFYTAGVDDFSIMLSHEGVAPAFYAKKHARSFHGTDKDMEGKLVSYRDDGTGRVRTVDLQEIKPELGLLLSVSELLDAAGVEMDKPYRQPAWSKGKDKDKDKDSKYRDDRPIRQTGIVIDCHIRYYNDWTTWVPAPTVKYTVEFVPASIQNSRFSTSYEVVGFGDARMMVKRAGVYVRVLHSGMLVRFSLVEMLQTIAVGFMLMTLSSWVLGQVATRYLPLAERYETHKYEYTENIFNLRASRDEFNDRVIEPQISVHEKIERSLKSKEEDMKDYGSMEPTTTPK